VSIEISQGNITRAATLAEESFTLAQELGTKPLIALVLESMGDVSLFLGEYERAAKLFEEHLVLAWELGDRPTIAKKRLHLGDCALVQGDLVQATTFVQESLKFFRGQDDNPNIAAALSVLGDIKRAENDLAQAMALYKEALLLDKELGKKKDTGRGLIGLAMVALKLGLLEQAVSLFGFAESYLVPQRDMHPAQRLQYESAVENAHARLGEKNFVTLWSRGNTMSFEEAFALMPF
jgi:tetratricopeptide (TPR) repeat protein